MFSEIREAGHRPAFLTPGGLSAILAVLCVAPLAHAQGGQLQSLPSAPAPAPASSSAAAPPSGPAPGQPPEGAVSGMGDINLYPKRLVIDEHNRVASIGIYNRTTNTGDYDITLVDKMMTEDGQIIDMAQVSDPAVAARVKTSSPFLRWSPHRVTLGNNESQLIRVMAHVPPDLPPGEYHTHFSVVAVPPDDGGLSIQQAAGQAGSKGIGVHITPRFGISIPVIVRVGATTLTVGITDIALTPMADGKPGIGMTITREGTRSAFGDIAVTAAGGGAPVAQVRGLGVYTEINRRLVKLAIDPKANPAALTHGARLTITYTDDDASPGKILARQEFTVP